jgi:cation diffusion facilitator family transporter
MDSCCEKKADELAMLKSAQAKVLYIVLAINAVMFIVEFGSGWLARSTALLADSLDMFGDASVYALTLFVLHRSELARAKAAAVKGAFMLLFGVVVIIDASYKAVSGVMPDAGLMGGIALLALLANTICFMLLRRHRSDDLNMRSTWICSRNDLIANCSVIGAAIVVVITGTFWPDVIVGFVIACLFIYSGWQVLTEARRAWLTCAQTNR